MTNRITWQHVSAPDFSGSNKLMVEGSNRISNAMKGLSDLAKEQIQNKQDKNLAMFNARLSGTSNQQEARNILSEAMSSGALNGATQQQLNNNYDLHLKMLKNAAERNRVANLQQKQFSLQQDKHNFNVEQANKPSFSTVKGVDGQVYRIDGSTGESQLIDTGSAPTPQGRGYFSAKGEDGELVIYSRETGEVVNPVGSNTSSKNKGFTKAKKELATNASSHYQTAQSTLDVLSSITQDDVSNAGGWSSIGGAWTPSSRASVGKLNQILAGQFMQNVVVR